MQLVDLQAQGVLGPYLRWGFDNLGAVTSGAADVRALVAALAANDEAALKAAEHKFVDDTAHAQVTFPRPHVGASALSHVELQAFEQEANAKKINWGEFLKNLITILGPLLGGLLTKPATP